MLVARRDPPFHGDACDPLSADKAPKVLRFVTVIQMTASLLAVPVGIGSAYTFYRANFAPETTCQTLRSGIIAMLDKSVDASTRRILVRRDVEAFEKTCAAVDPDATAAFKSLLAVEKSSAPLAATTPAEKLQSNDAAPKEPVRKAEPRPQTAPKQAVTNTQSPPAQSIHKDPVSDTQWLDAVRQALTAHQDGSRPAEATKPRTVSAPAARPAQREAEPPAAASAPTPATAASTPLPPAAAPALPPPVAVAPASAQRKATRAPDADHPVPPESIPDTAQFAATEVKTDEEPGRSKIGKWISAIPLLGPVVDNARH